MPSEDRSTAPRLLAWLRRAFGRRDESDAIYRALAENASGLVTVLDAEGRILFASPGHEKELGYAAEELRGRQAFEVFAVEDDTGERSALEREVERGDSGPHLLRVRHRDGSYRWLETSGTRSITPAGELRVIGISRDVTEMQGQLEELAERRRKAEALERELAQGASRLAEATQRLEELQTRLAEAQRLSAPVNLGSMAHSINNPLAALKGVVEMALEAADGKDATLERVLHLARRIEKVVDGTLGFFRHRVLELEPCSPAEVLESVRDELQERAAAGRVRLELKSVIGRKGLSADAGLLTSALVCIAENSLEAMPDGGALWLESESDDEASVSLRIADTGPGIPPELRAKVLEPFFTTKGGGTGLGLTIANRIVRAHYGAIHIDEHAGGGAAVTVRLPFSAEASDPARAS